MIILYAIFIFLLVTSFRIYKKENPILFGAIILLLLISGNKVRFLASEYVLMLLKLFNNSLFTSTITILVLSYIVSELFWLLGFQKYMEQKLINKSYKIQKLYILILSMFSTNVTYSQSKLVKENASLLNSNSFILSTLNIFSPIVILINLLVLIVYDGSGEAVLFLIYVSNGVAFFWFLKNVIDIFTSRGLTFEVNEKRMVNYKIAINNNMNNYTKFKDVFIITPIIFLMTFFLMHDVMSIFAIIDVTLIFLTILLFIKVIKYSYNSNEIEEKYIYRAILNTFISILNTVFIIINASILVELLISVFLAGIYLPLLTVDIYLLLFLVYTVIILIYSKRYEFAAITIFPILSLLSNNGLSLTDIYLSCSIFAIIMLVKQFSIVEFNKKLLIDYIVTSVLIGSTYLILLTTTNQIYFYLSIFISLVIYMVFNLFYKEKS